MRLILSRTAAVAVCLACAAAGRADEWVVNRSVAARTTYNDNVNMQPTKREAATYVAVTPTVALVNRTETRQIGLTLAATANRYLDRPALNTIDHSGSIEYRQSGERDNWSLTASSLRDSTLMTELATTGIVLARRQRTQNTGIASWQHSITERASVSASAKVTTANYEPAPGLRDFRDDSYSLGGNYRLTERATAGLSLSKRHYRNDDHTVDTRATSVALTGQYRYSERLQLSGQWGTDSTRTGLKQSLPICMLPPILVFNFPRDQCLALSGTPTALVLSSGSRSHGTNYNATAGYALENGSITLTAGRSLNASGTGSLLRSDQLNLSYQRDLNERFGYALGAATVRSSFLGASSVETRYSSVQSSLQWKLDPMITLSASLTHSTQRTTGQPVPITANVVFVSLNYAFDPLSFSR